MFAVPDSCLDTSEVLYTVHVYMHAYNMDSLCQYKAEVAFTAVTAVSLSMVLSTSFAHMESKILASLYCRIAPGESDQIQV